MITTIAHSFAAAGVLFAVVVFLVGLVSEQIATLRFEGPRP